MNAELRLPSGRAVQLSHPAIPLLPHYHVLHLRDDDGPPTEPEIDQMLALARRVARMLGRLHLGDGECFSLIVNGERTRRSPGLHVHILPARSVARKRLAFMLLLWKGWLRRAGGLARTTRRTARVATRW